MCQSGLGLWTFAPSRTRTPASSTGRLGVTQNELGDLKIVAHSSLPETADDAIAILHVAILTHLPLALQPRDGQAESDNATQHRLNVGLGCIRERPWHSFAPLLLSGQLGDVAPYPIRLLHHLRLTIDVNDCIIPRRNDFRVLGFRGVPVGCDVSLRSLEDHQGFVALSKMLPVRVGAGEMEFDHPIWSIVLEHSRQMSGVEAFRASRYDRGKGPGPHKRVHQRQIVDAVMVGLIHRFAEDGSLKIWGLATNQLQYYAGTAVARAVGGSKGSFARVAAGHTAAAPPRSEPPNVRFFNRTDRTVLILPARSSGFPWGSRWRLSSHAIKRAPPFEQTGR